MRYELLGFAVTQSHLKHSKRAHSAVKPTLTMLTWLATNTNNAGASPNPSALSIAAITSFNISTMFTLPIPNTHRYVSDVKLGC
jgi:hypothetical protein